MKKTIIWFAIAFVLGLSTLSNFAGRTTYAASSEINKIVQKEIKKLEKKKVAGFHYYDAYSVHLTGKDMPEIAVSSIGYEKGTEFIDKSLLQIYQYNKSKKQWKVINKFLYKDEMYTYKPLRFITKGKLMGDKREQLVAAYIWGSDNAFTPIVFGSTDGKKIKAFINNKQSYTDGTAIIKNKELFFVEFLSTVSKKYLFKKNKLVGYKGTGKDDRKLAGSAKHLLMLEKKNGNPYLSGGSTVKMKIGESLSIVRKSKTDTSSYIFRMFVDPGVLNGVGPLQNTGGALKAIKPGNVEMSFIIGYDTKTINVKVTR